MRILSVNLSDAKGTVKTPVDTAKLLKDHGLEGDAHAGPGERQVSLLAEESYTRFEDSGADKLCLKHGAFGENIVTEGIVLHELPVGQRLRIGEAVLEVTRIGKECHAPCHIAKTMGRCIMPDEGIFARVIESGDISVGDIISS